jgi:hypothetical protein
MPPHCDSLDGPVVKAASQSLEKSDVNIVLPYVPKSASKEIASVFERVRKVRRDNPDARQVADQLFFETVVRLHRAGEGAPFTGLKPAGLDVGPVIPAAERAIETGSVHELAELLCDILREEVGSRFQQVMRLKDRAGTGVDEAREYVSAMLGLEVYAHTIYKSLKATGHDGHAHRVEK